MINYIGNTRVRLLNQPISQGTLDYFYENLERIEVKRGSYLIREGEAEHYLYFIEKGIIRYYITNNLSDEEISFWFSFSGEFVNSYKSFITGEPSELGIQAIKPCILWRAEKDFILNTFQNNPEVCFSTLTVMQDISTRKIEHEILLLKYKPEERYKVMQSEEKEIMTNIPLKYLASYIGITPQALSRIRKRIIKESKRANH